jgi:cell division protein FtsZ
MTPSPRITIIGVGGAGGNAVNNMIRANLEGVEFLVCNTDAQALGHSVAQRKIQLGLQTTRGLGAGSKPEVGRAAAEESLEELSGIVDGSNMVFITAGMGGGTGTGAAPIIARMAREQNILTVGVVTKPFQFEGAHRMKTAEAGIQELQQYVDTLIVIPNQNLFRIANERTTFADAFKMADEVLHSGVRGVTDLIVMPGLINLDFADIRTVMSEMGKAMMGTGEATGEERAARAADAAISNPLLDEVSLKGARAMLINITAGMDMSLHEVDEVVNRVRAEVDPDANVIFGSTFDQAMDGKLRVSVVATGMDVPAPAQRPLLEVIRGGVAVEKLAPVTEPAEPPAPAEAPPARAAEPVQAAPPAMPSAPTVRPPSIDTGVYIPVSARPLSAEPPVPEPKRSFSLFERLTGAARRNQDDK